MKVTTEKTALLRRETSEARPLWRSQPCKRLVNGDTPCKDRQRFGLCENVRATRVEG